MGKRLWPDLIMAAREFRCSYSNWRRKLPVDLTVELSPLHSVVGVPVQSLYGEDRVYTVRDDRLQAITVASLGQRIDSEGNYQILVRAAELRAGTPLLTTTLPKASTGLRVAVIGAGELAVAAND